MAAERWHQVNQLLQAALARDENQRLRRLGAFQVQALIGIGGMGEVYRARDTKLGREVAIEILPRLLTAHAA